MNMNECPLYRATNACSDGLPPPGTDYGNGLTFCVTNAKIICRSKKGHCEICTIVEGKMMAGILIVYIRVGTLHVQYSILEVRVHQKLSLMPWTWSLVFLLLNIGHLCVWRRLVHMFLILTGGDQMSGVRR